MELLSQFRGGGESTSSSKVKDTMASSVTIMKEGGQGSKDKSRHSKVHPIETEIHETEENDNDAMEKLKLLKQSKKKQNENNPPKAHRKK